MMKNDYRRSLIMLRIHAPGYSGHVRLERRTLMGTMYAVINAPNDGRTLCASLVRVSASGDYSAVRIGDLRRDGRGQANLAYSFDPRNIEGFPLEEYRLIAITARDAAGRCAVVLSGSINGSRELDWNGVQAAACAACRPPVCESCPPPVNIPARPGEGPLGPQTPVVPPADVPARPGEGPAGTQTPTVPPADVPARPGEGPLGPQTPTVPPADIPARPGEGPAGTQTPTVPPADVPARPGEGPAGTQTPVVSSGGTALPEFALPDGEAVTEAAGEDRLPDRLQPADDLPEGLPLPATFAREAVTAAEVLGLDPCVRWPGVAEQVRMYFMQPPQELTMNDGYTYVSAPMPEGSGFDRVEVGLKAQDGVPVSVAYALEAAFSHQPPEGLENYQWKNGYWVIKTDNFTGERIR